MIYLSSIAGFSFFLIVALIISIVFCSACAKSFIPKDSKFSFSSYEVSIILIFCFIFFLSLDALKESHRTRTISHDHLITFSGPKITISQEGSNLNTVIIVEETTLNYKENKKTIETHELIIDEWESSDEIYFIKKHNKLKAVYVIYTKKGKVFLISKGKDTAKSVEVKRIVKL